MTQNNPNFIQSTQDPWAETQPTHTATPIQVHRVKAAPRTRRSCWQSCGCGCGTPILGIALGIAVLLMVYLFTPSRTNILLLGIDQTAPENAVGRSDTIILSTINPLKPYVGLLSIPRDLWVNIPGVGENRINTAHFFAEAAAADSGPLAAMDTVRQNFGIDVDYYLRLRFEGFRDVIDAMGGVDLILPEPMAGYPAGPLHLNGNKALAFTRHRLGSDDFFRMEHTQFLLIATLRQMLNPRHLVRIPVFIAAAGRSIDTNLPAWQWPRLLLAILRLGPDGIDNRTINREMVTPIITAEGASVLLPDWDKINPVLYDMFGL